MKMGESGTLSMLAGPHASPAPAEAAADTQLHAPSQAPQAAAADPRQRSADSRQRAADPRLVAAQAQVWPELNLLLMCLERSVMSQAAL